MKRLLLKTMLLLCALVVGSSSLWAESYTITFKANSGDGTAVTTSTACSEIVSNGATYLSGNVVTATNVYYNGGSGLKLGKSSGSGTIKMNLASAVTPTSIVVNAKLYNSSKSATLKVNGSATQNVTSSFSDLTFNITSNTTYLELVSSKYCWISSITVNYSGSNKKAAELSFAVPSYKVAPNTLFAQVVTNPNNLSVTYTSSDDDIATVDGNTGDILTGDKTGTATITASSAEDSEYNAGEATYTITVYDPAANDGSEAKPYTVTEALALINTLGTASSSPVYVKGIVSTELSSINSTNGYANYYISVDGTTTSQLECYKGYNLGKTKFTATSDLSLGDEVVVYGSLKMYNTTPEFNSNNFITQLKHGSEPEVKSLEVKAAEYRTYVASANLVVPAGVKAYIATGESETTLTLKSVAKIKEGSPVILNATEGYYSFEITDDAIDYGTDTNLLQISDGTVTNGVFVLAKINDQVGFYKWAGGALSPGKVYVEAPSSAAREFLGFNFDDITGINDVKGEKKAVDGIFDLQGRKVITPSKGLYIMNGKKVVIK